MTTWMLYVILTTGEAGPVPVSEYVCRKLAVDLAAGAVVRVDRDDGSNVGITAAACLGPAEVADPCNVEGLS